MMAIEKNAWNGIAANSRPMRAIGGSRTGVGIDADEHEEEQEPDRQEVELHHDVPEMVAHQGRRTAT